MVKQLGILYKEKKNPIKLRMADGIRPIYRGGIIYLKTQKVIVKIKGLLFNIKFNITKLTKEGIILGIL